MAGSNVINLLGIFHTDRDIPSDIFVMRKRTDFSALNALVGELLVDKFRVREDEGVPGYMPSAWIARSGSPINTEVTWTRYNLKLLTSVSTATRATTSEW